MSNPVYSTSYDHDMKGVVLYAGDTVSGGGRLLCKELDGEPISANELVELFLKNMIVIKEFNDVFDSGVAYYTAYRCVPPATPYGACMLLAPDNGEYWSAGTLPVLF